ncbi:hypothetical protein [Pedobacter terrae]|uniref:hypothetical protein n=1 Tax=Pedobacter terrae TaxID=405671 RepID=UPI002FF45395
MTKMVNLLLNKAFKTAGKPHHILLASDRKTLDADGKDLAYITASVVDANGTLCPDADNSLAFKVTGSGTYKAVAQWRSDQFGIVSPPKNEDL